MTKEELINHLEHLADYVKYSEDAPALREAIEMLTEERTQKRTGTHACDCISRQAEIDSQGGEEMNKQRKVVITTTYNEMGIIIDTKAEEVAQPNLQPTCNQPATDTISRQAAIDAIKKLEKHAPTAQHLSAIFDCEDTIKALPPAQQWIPCSERLPEEYGNYLATMDDGDVQECTYSPEKNTPFMRGGWSTCEADGIVYLDIAEVIAWMPLPAPYQGEGDSNDRQM